jgi:hypothetical protein
VGVDEDRQSTAVCADDLQRDLAHRPLHPQQRRVVGLVIDPAAGREQILEALSADQVVAPVPRPGQQRLVDLRDGSVRERREVAARGMLVEIFGAVLQQASIGRLVGLVLLGQPPARLTGTP